MALWVCNRCTTKYAVGLPYCPQCTSTDHREDGEDMAKTTVHGGPSDKDAVPGQPGYQAPAEAAPARLDTPATRDLDEADELLASSAAQDEPGDGYEAVPEGDVKTVLAWVGDDPERATRALEVERAARQPRSTLIAKLQEIVTG